MARRHTNNIVNAVGEIDAFFHGLNPGVAKRLRCGRCEADNRLTLASAKKWFLGHRCADEVVSIGGEWWRDCTACGWRNYTEPPNGTPRWHVPDNCVDCGARLPALGTGYDSHEHLARRAVAA